MSFLPAPFTFMLNLERFKNLWYVYKVSTAEGLYYIGVADDRHLMTLQDAIANPKVRDHLLKCGLVVVEVLSSHHTQADARKAAFPHISAHKPIGNQYGIAFQPRSKRVKCVETGNVFDSVTDAAQWAGVALASMSNHLYRRNGYARVRGHTFEFEAPTQ